jgi:16S rRNA G966 N2-methylase RsmD
MLKVADRTTIVSGDLFKWFADLPTTGPGDTDLIFLDPPYRFLKERPGDLQTLARQMQVYHLSDDGIIIFRHDAADSLALPLRRFEVRTYGSMTLEFLRRDTTDHGQQTTDN